MADVQQDNQKCQKPENLKAKPAECTPEQITQCHGDVDEHPCLEGDDHK